MRKLIIYFGLLASTVFLPAAFAQVQTLVSESPADMAVTVYPDNLAMITETRTVDLPAGRSRISFEGVNDQIIPQTALLTEFGAVSIERNFDYDLLTRQALFENALGEEVTLIRTLPGSGEVKLERATVLAGGQGVVFQIGQRVETYQCSGLSERVQFDERPKRFQTRPTLSLTVDAEEAGPQTMEFRYLASGFNWRADYIMSLNSGARADLHAWLTMSNETGIDVTNAEVSVVAGALARRDETDAPLIKPDAFVANCQPGQNAGWQFRDGGSFGGFDRLETVVVTASRIQSLDTGQPVIAEREDLGDYKLYRAPFATTLAARQTKQIAFLDKSRIKFEKIYAFDFAVNDRRYFRVDRGGLNDAQNQVLHAQTRYVVDNSRRGRLAEPLPAGVVRVMAERGNDDPFYIGQDTIDDLAIGAPVEIDAGYTSELVLIWETLSTDRPTALGGGRRRLIARDQELTFMNTMGRRARVEFSVALEPDERILEPSLAPEEDALQPKWQFTIPANGTRSLTFELVSRN